MPVGAAAQNARIVTNTGHGVAAIVGGCALIARGTAGGSKSVAAWNAQGVKLTDAGVANTVTTLVRSR